MTSDPGFLPFLSSVEKRKGVNWQITGILTCPVFLFVLSFYVLLIVFSLKDRADSESLTYFSTKQDKARPNKGRCQKKTEFIWDFVPNYG